MKDFSNEIDILGDVATALGGFSSCTSREEGEAFRTLAAKIMMVMCALSNADNFAAGLEETTAIIACKTNQMRALMEKGDQNEH